MTKPTIRALVATIAVVVSLLATPSGASAHCDTMDGPVVRAGQRALETGNVNLALIWVRVEDEPEIRSAFDRAQRVRRAGGDAAELADYWFFETLVRVHRAGEGEAYTGLKPAGSDLGPVIPMADEAIASGALTDLDAMLVHALRDGLRSRFQELMGRSVYTPDDVGAGRRFVEAYVAFVHYTEQVHATASSGLAAHRDPAARAEPEHLHP